jgi:regulator of nucleoside diphosphate kinase
MTCDSVRRTTEAGGVSFYENVREIRINRSTISNSPNGHSHVHIYQDALSRRIAMQPTIRVFTAEDQDRLRQFISAHQARIAREADALAQLDARVEEGEMVSADEVSGDIVTIYSQIRVQDIDNGRSWVLTVALPAESDFQGQNTLLNAYPAVELIGARVGDEFEWYSAGQQRRARVEEILFQPEASNRHSRQRARQTVLGQPASAGLPPKAATVSRPVMTVGA